MTDENLDTGEEVTPTPGEGEASPSVDVEAIREQLKSELEADWQKERTGLQSAANAERKKRQEIERQIQERQTTETPRHGEDDEEFRTRLREEVRQEMRQAEVERSQSETVKKFSGAATSDGVRKMFGENDPMEAARGVCETLKYHPELQLQIMRSENSWALMKHLSENPDALNRMASSTAYQAGIELGRIDASMAKGGPKLTNAPDPITPIEGGASDVDDIYELEGSAYEEQLRKRNGGSVFPR